MSCRHSLSPHLNVDSSGVYIYVWGGLSLSIKEVVVLAAGDQGQLWSPAGASHFCAVPQGRSRCYCSPIASTSGRYCRTAPSTRCCSMTWRMPSPWISTTGGSWFSGQMSPWTASSGPTSMAAMWRRSCPRGWRVQVGEAGKWGGQALFLLLDQETGKELESLGQLNLLFSQR